MGAAIIEAIKSGLGLIADLAKEFLTAFTTLFWDKCASSGTDALTEFETFALVMLVFSVTFSIVKLCMSILRGKTGI